MHPPFLSMMSAHQWEWGKHPGQECTRAQARARLFPCSSLFVSFLKKKCGAGIIIHHHRLVFFKILEQESSSFIIDKLNRVLA